jgi:hypothetical protein
MQEHLQQTADCMYILPTWFLNKWITTLVDAFNRKVQAQLRVLRKDDPLTKSYASNTLSLHNNKNVPGLDARPSTDCRQIKGYHRNIIIFVISMCKNILSYLLTLYMNITLIFREGNNKELRYTFFLSIHCCKFWHLYCNSSNSMSSLHKSWVWGCHGMTVPGMFCILFWLFHIFAHYHVTQ